MNNIARLLLPSLGRLAQPSLLGRRSRQRHLISLISVPPIYVVSAFPVGSSRAFGLWVVFFRGKWKSQWANVNPRPSSKTRTTGQRRADSHAIIAATVAPWTHIHTAKNKTKAGRLK